MVNMFRVPTLFAGLLIAGCSSAAQSPRQLAPTDVVATVGSTEITLAEVDDDALSRSTTEFGGVSLAQALYDARRAVIEQRIATLLITAEAETTGVDLETLIEQEITAKASAPTDLEIEAWYRANPMRVRGAALDEVREPIRQLLTEERREAARLSYIDRLAAKTGISIALNPPRTMVSEEGRPAKGPADAPVQIVEFSDFECPFCFQANSTIARVLETYGDRIRFVYRNYTLPNHPNARPAAEAAACAAEQEQFWAYHDQLFANQERLTEADLKQHAAALGLDTDTFNTCFDERRYRADVDADLAAAEAAGVTGTPAFFINGRLVSGAQPFELFRRVIDEELQFKAR